VLFNKTKIDRKDIAHGCRTYQSSDVDNLESHYALQPPYQMGSKTRREADPWWEIDLGLTQVVHSLSFCVMGAVQHDLRIHALLFDKPVGFENPFLERYAADINTFLFLCLIVIINHCHLYTVLC
jgi:hypothetical protein